MVQILTGLVLLPLAVWTFWLWLLALRSLTPRPEPAPASELPFFTVLVPAHDEAALIGRTVGLLRAVDYPCERYSLHVVADNCTDATAALAVAAGALCHERRDAQTRGKSYALAYGLEAVRHEPYDAVLFFDADSSPEPEYLRVMAARLAAGERVIQGRYDVHEPDRNWFTRLTAVSFMLRNVWIFPGLDALGISLPLRGSGMCFARAVIDRVGWTAHGLTEDAAMTLRLLEEGECVTFAPRAVCRQYMPPTPGAAVAQRLRWSAGESGLRGQLLRALLRAVRRGAWRRAGTLALMAAPSFSEQLCVVLALCVIAWLLPGPGLFVCAFSLWLAYTVYFLLGFGRLDRLAVQALVMLPVFAAWRSAVALAARLRKPADWVRTPRK